MISDVLAEEPSALLCVIFGHPTRAAKGFQERVAKTIDKTLDAVWMLWGSPKETLDAVDTVRGG